MSDIVERLRDHHRYGICQADTDAAAAEITALRAKLAEAERERDYWKVEADGERAKVAYRESRATALAAEVESILAAWDSRPKSCHLPNAMTTWLLTMRPSVEAARAVLRDKT